MLSLLTSAVSFVINIITPVLKKEYLSKQGRSECNLACTVMRYD